MNLGKLKIKVAPAAIAFGLTVSGCATNSIDREGMQTRSTQLLIFGQSETRFNEEAARANVLDLGTTNPNPVVAQVAREAGCIARGELGERFRRRDDWRATSGQSVSCPQAPAPVATPSQP